jgi:hypothetical protein
MRKLILLLLIPIFTLGTKANIISDSLRISLLTVAPGSELYSTFGHSAIRVVDLKNGYDIVFNYGTFDFSTDGFYFKFALGSLDYQLAIEQFESFMESNRAEKRSVVEQELNLSNDKKFYLVSLLLTNYKPENRSYRYKFFTDNCATRIRDVFVISLSDYELFVRNRNALADRSFRELFTSYLGNMPWARFGIELVLGKMTDKKAGYDAMFLPDVLHSAFANAYVEGRKLVLSEKVIYKGELQENKTSWFSPLVLSILILVIVLLIQLFQNIVPTFDRIYFFVFGFLGLFILSLSVFSHHNELHWNFVTFLLLPTNMLLTFAKGLKLRKIYSVIAFSITVFIIALSPFLPQSFNMAVFLLGVATAIRLFFNFVPLSVKKQ